MAKVEHQLTNGMSSYHKFRAFLRERGCEQSFDRAYYHFNDFTLLDESLWEAGDAEMIFGHAFDWCATPEGRDFWRERDREWYRLCSNIL